MLSPIERLPKERAYPLDLFLLLILSALVYGYRLGEGGLTNTEGHRVVPAWEMLETGNLFTQRLFGQIYLRKPPGHSWFIALGTLLCGPNEWGARCAGAAAGVGMVVGTYVFARRWFGPTAGLPAALCQLLTPVFWKYQRSAEIEGVLTLTTHLLVLCLLDLCLRRSSSRSNRWLLTLLATFSLAVGVAVKGPAIAPPLLAVLAAIAHVGGLRSLVRRELATLLVLSIAFSLGLFALIVTHAHGSGEPVVTERVFGFRWSWEILAGMLALIPKSLVQSLPASLLLLVPWCVSSANQPIARAIAQASVGSILLYSAVGLVNERYTLPAFSFVAVLAGFAWTATVGSSPNSFSLARLYTRASYRWTAAGLAFAWVGYVGWVEPTVRSKSGRAEGERLAELLPNGAHLWADGLIDARPETLAYAQQAARRLGKEFAIRWQPANLQPWGAAPRGDSDWYLLRTDGKPSEWEVSTHAGERWTPVAEGSVYKYPYILARPAVEQSAGREPASRRW